MKEFRHIVKDYWTRHEIIIRINLKRKINVLKFCHSLRDRFKVNNCILLNDIDSPLNSTKRKVNDEDISIKGNKGGRKEEWKDVVDF